MCCSSEDLEALERAVREIEALQAIYDGDGVVVIILPSQDDLETIQAKLLLDEEAITNIPTLTVQFKLQQQQQQKQQACKQTASLMCNLPPGYPATAPAKVYVTLESGFHTVNRGTIEEITQRLVEIAENSVGQESLMELVQTLQDSLAELAQLGTEDESPTTLQNNNSTASAESLLYSRRWIWVHHITNAGRKKDIVREAKELKLGGFLKAGYPGVVVVEGPVPACDEFVIWIKGNKSRPGGFGRNWGHHVRGEIVLTESQRCRLPTEFQELEEDLAVLSAACKDHGLEEEFLEYVMQHKVSTSSSNDGNVEGDDQKQGWGN